MTFADRERLYRLYETSGLSQKAFCARLAVQTGLRVSPRTLARLRAAREAQQAQAGASPYAFLQALEQQLLLAHFRLWSDEQSHV